MSALNLVYDDLPEVLEMPKEVQHHSVKITITPLDDNKKSKQGSSDKPANWLSNFAGRWEGTPLVREDQGEYEERDRLE